MQTVHISHGEPTALLAGDVMFVKAYENLNKIQPAVLAKVHLLMLLQAGIYEGQQLDMDFEKNPPLVLMLIST